MRDHWMVVGSYNGEVVSIWAGIRTEAHALTFAAQEAARQAALRFPLTLEVAPESAGLQTQQQARTGPKGNRTVKKTFVLMALLGGILGGALERYATSHLTAQAPLMIALRSPVNGKFVTMWDEFQGQHPLIANRSAASSGETFEVVVMSGGGTLVPTSPVATPVPPSAIPADQIDLKTVQVHSSPGDISSWSIGTKITRVSVNPYGPSPYGWNVVAQIPNNWSYRVPGWGSPSTTGCPNDGCIDYTMHFVVKVGGQWHEAGLQEMWRGREGVGAFTTGSWHWEFAANYAYDPGRWGVMNGYQPNPGEEMGIFISAGDARAYAPGYSGVTSVRERSQVVKVILPANDTGTWSF